MKPRFSYACPTVKFTFTNNASDVYALAAEIEDFVPGARVTCCGKRLIYDKTRFATKNDEIVVTAPIHASLLLKKSGLIKDYTFELNGLQYDACLVRELKDRWYESPNWLVSDSIKESLEIAGRRTVDKLVHQGWLSKSTGESYYPYQLRSIGWAMTRASSWLGIKAGGGKTRVGMACALGRLLELNKNGTILVLGPVISNDAWDSQSPDITGQYMGLGHTNRLGIHKHHILRVWTLKPKSYQLKRDPTYEEYVAWCRSHNIPPIVFVGDETTPHVWELLDSLNINPTVVIVDEPHLMADRERLKVTSDANGNVVFKQATTKTGTAKRAALRNEILKQRSIKSWIGLDGTPLGDGRSRRLWAPLDLLDPFAYGTYSAFRKRYTSPTDDAYTQFDDSEWRNQDELMWRARWMLMEVPHEEIKKHMPPVRYEARWLPVALQAKVQVNLFAKDDDAEEHDEEAASNVLERRLAVACQAKLPAIVDAVVEGHGVDKSVKTLVFVGRRKQAPLFAQEIEKALDKYWKGDCKPRHSKPGVRWANGETSMENRLLLVDWFRQESSAILVITYQAMGTSIDGLQCATNVEVAMLPTGPDRWEQLVGRVDRLGSVGALIRAWFAEKTYDERAFSLFRSRAMDVSSALTVMGTEVGVAAEALRNEAALREALADLTSGIDFSAWDNGAEDE